MSQFSLLMVTCKSKVEADHISSHLLKKKLIACAKTYTVNSTFIWESKIDNSSEIMLMMETKSKYFKKIETIVHELHSYDTPVLISIPINNISSKAKVWLDLEIK